ncbi:FAD binding domain-containing protein [Acidobacteriota bacterium]
MTVKEYVSPRNLQETADFLNSYSGPAKLLAGGTDLLIQLSGDKNSETGLISLKNLNELKEISLIHSTEVFIGSMARHTDVAHSPLVNQHFPALAKASSLVGSPSIRNMATLGGNICNASPSAETAPPLMIYDARVLIWNPSGEREIAIENFFSGPSMNILEKGEILKGFLLKPQNKLVADYEKLGIRKAMEISIVNVGISMIRTSDNICSQVRIALGAVAPTPIRARKAEAVLLNKKVTPSLIEKAAEVAKSEANPISDIRASADYRNDMIGLMVKNMMTKFSSL